VILRENLRYVIVSDKLLLVELSEYPFSEGFLYGFKVYLLLRQKGKVSWGSKAYYPRRWERA
jgi:hypothetical protein